MEAAGRDLIEVSQLGPHLPPKGCGQRPLVSRETKVINRWGPLSWTAGQVWSLVVRPRWPVSWVV